MIDNMFNKTFGELTILPIEPKIGQNYSKKYLCKCKCGNEKWVKKGNLTSGFTKSCGCYHKKQMIKIGEKNKKLGFIDLTNNRFERLLVLSCQGLKNKHYYWLCRCDCGNEKIILGSNLTGNRVKSCGCLNKEVLKKRAKLYRISKGKDPNIFMHNIIATERAEFIRSEIYQQVLKRDNYKCQFCPNVYENLEVHHILSWSKYPKLRYELNNLITLCKICHIPIIHNGDIQIEPHEQTTKILKNIIKNKGI